MASGLTKFFSKSPGESRYTWTCGQDSGISHRQPIGSGGYAEVHEVRHAIHSEVLIKFLDGVQEDKTSNLLLLTFLTRRRSRERFYVSRTQ